MKKNKLIGLLLTTTTLLALSTQTISTTVYADDVVDKTEETTDSGEDKENKEENVSDKKEDKKDVDEKDNSISNKIEEIKKSNKSSSDKAKELLNVYSAHLENQQKLANDISILKVKLDDKELELAEKSEDLGKTESKLKEKVKELDKKKDEVEKSEQRLKDIEKEIKILDEKIKNKKEVMAERAKALQINMNTSSNKFLEVILNAESISDAVSKLVAINTIQTADNELRESFENDVEEQKTLENEQKELLKNKKEEQNSIQDKVDTIQKEKDTIEKTKKELEENLTKLNSDKKDFDEKTKQASEDIKTLSSELSSLTDGMGDFISELNSIKSKLDKEKNKDEIKEIDRIINEIKTLQENARLAEEARQNNQNSINLNSDVGVPTIVDKDVYTKSQKKLIETAEKYLGVPYVWGGTAPNGLDCSGLTQRVYREAVGVEITRVTYTQQYQGKEVSLSDIQVGDLIFWGEPTYHVAIYAGNGYYIHAPKPEDVVRYSNYNLNGVSHIRRIIDYK